MIATYICTDAACGGSITIDTEKRTQHVVYLRNKGPLSEKYQFHDCPVARGLWPPEIDSHPLARKVA